MVIIFPGKGVIVLSLIATVAIVAIFHCGEKVGSKALAAIFKIIITSLAGGLLCPYKGLLPAASQDTLNVLPTAKPFLPALKGYLFFFPVNGSIYSFKLN